MDYLGQRLYDMLPMAPARSRNAVRQSALHAVQEVRPAAWHATLVGVLVVARVLGLRVIWGGRWNLPVGPRGGVHPLGHGVREGWPRRVVRVRLRREACGVPGERE